MFVAHQQRNRDDGESANEGAYDGDEFEHPSDCAQNQGVLNSHHSEKCGVHHQRKGRQSELGADEVRQHPVQIVEHVLEEFPLRPRLNRREREIAEGAAIF